MDQPDESAVTVMRLGKAAIRRTLSVTVAVILPAAFILLLMLALRPADQLPTATVTERERCAILQPAEGGGTRLVERPCPDGTAR